MGSTKRFVKRVLNPGKAKVGVKNFAGSLWDRFHGLDYAFERCEGASLLDVASCEGLISYEFVRRGARLVHAIERDKDRVQFSKRLFRDVPIESNFEAGNVAISGSEFERKHSAWLLPQYDIVLFLGIYHHLERQMPVDDLNDLVRLLAERTGKYMVVRTFENESMEATIVKAGLERVHFIEGIKDERGPLMIYARKD